MEKKGIGLCRAARTAAYGLKSGGKGKGGLYNPRGNLGGKQSGRAVNTAVARLSSKYERKETERGAKESKGG